MIDEERLQGLEMAASIGGGGVVMDGDEICELVEEVRLHRAQMESLRVLADDVRRDARPEEAPILAGIDSVLRSRLDENGMLEAPILTGMAPP